MANNSPTIVAASLSDDQLKKSIDSLVTHVDEAMKKMVQSTNNAVGEMEAKLKSLGNLKIDSGGTNDGGASKRAKAQNAETDAIDKTIAARGKQIKQNQEAAMSFDQIAAALDKARRTVSEFNTSRASGILPSSEDYKRYEQALARIVEYNDKLKQSALGKAFGNEQAFAFDAKRVVSDITAVDERLKQLGKYYAEQEKQAQKTSSSINKQLEDEVGRRNIVIEQMRAYYKEQERISKEAAKIQNKDFREQFRGALSLPVNDILDAYRKIDRLRNLLEEMRAKKKDKIVDISEADFNRVSNAITSLRSKIDKMYEQRAKAREKESAAQKKMIDDQYKLSFARAMKIPTDQLDLAQAKLERLQALLRDMRERGILSNTQIASTEAEIRKLEQIIGQVSAAQQQTTQSAQRYTEEIRKQAQAIRESQQWKEKGFVTVGNDVFYDPARSKAQTLSLEEQMLNAENRRIEAQEKLNAESQKEVEIKSQLPKQGYLFDGNTRDESSRQQQSRAALERYKQIQQEEQNVNSLNAAIMRSLHIGKDEVKNYDIRTASAKQLNAMLKQQRDAYANLTTSQRSQKGGVELAESIQRTGRALQKLQAAASRPISLQFAMGLSEKTLDEMAYKMRQLASYRGGLDIKTQANEIDQVNRKYAELQKSMNDIMRKNTEMIKSNTAVGRSWNYMKNRLAFYFTVGASTQFIKNLIDVRSQYEMNERALGILIDSAERGTRIFNELSQMALVSPYTLIELSTAAKQLTAYDVAAKDVVDTTRRLADMASAVGIPIERLTYALGQIKAYGYLNARDARMFSNAGIPLVKQLADYYTELEGKLVSTADIYDRIKKKAIGYNDVMSVMYKMTDEGGKFFDFQSKMADTLKVRLANLTLAWNNMLNDMGKESQGVLTWGIGALRELFLQWRTFDKTLKEAAGAFGLYKAIQLIILGLQTATKSTLGLNARLTATGVLGTRLLTIFKALGSAMKSLAANWWLILVAAAVELSSAIINANEATKEFNKSMREGAESTANDLKKYIEQYKDLRDSLYKTQTQTLPNGKTKSTLVPQDIDKNEASKAWEAMREQIELSSAASTDFVSRLLQIENVSDRLREGFKIIDDITQVNAALKDMGDEALVVTQKWSAWWNAWQAPDGLFTNLKEFKVELDEIRQKYGDIANARYVAEHGDTNRAANEQDAIMRAASEAVNDYDREMNRFRVDLDKYTSSLDNFANAMEFSSNPTQVAELYAKAVKQLVTQGQLNPQEAFDLQLQIEEARTNAMKLALQSRIADEESALKLAQDERTKESLNASIESNKAQLKLFENSTYEQTAYWNDFTKYIKERHISELTAAYNAMTENGKKEMDFQSVEWQNYVHKWANSYEKSHNLATDSVFNRIKNWINDANTWSIFIKMTISTEDKKSVYKELGEWDKAADDAYKTMQRLDKEISRLRKKGAKEVGVMLENNASADDKKLTQAIEERTQAQKDYNEAVANGGESKKKDAAGSKAQKAAESELAKALKDELSTIDKVRSIYKDLTKEGMSHANAVERATRGWDETVNAINRVLQKNGLQKLDLSKFAGIENPRELVNMLQSQLNTLLKRGAKPAEIKELQTKIQTLNVDAEKYDLTKITKGLNNELGKLKDEYELAVELDANPELGGMFLDMFGIDPSDFSHSIDDYMFKVQSAFEKARKELGYGVTIDVFKANDEEWKKWGEWVGLSGDALDNFKARFVGAQGVAKKWATDVVNNTKKLEYELAELNDKIAIKEKEQAQLHERIEKEKNEVTKHYLELIYQSNEKAIDELRSQALSLMPEYARVFNSIAEYSAGVSRRLQRDLMRVFDEAKYDSANKKWTLTGSDGKQTILNDTQYRKEREKLTKEMRKSQAPFKKIKEAFKPSDANGVVDYAKGIELISGEVQKLGSVASEVGNLAQIFGADEQTVEVINDVATSLNGVATAGQGISQIASGDYLGGAASLLSGITSVIGAWGDNSNKRIDAEIKDSERAVKQLELAYKNLEVAIEDAYGTNVIGAKQAAIANKELQLAELQRQLALEKSRDGKKRDEDKIVELQGQIIDLQNDIKRSTQEITTELLGISSVADAAQGFMDSYIDALRSGEDAMEGFNESVNDMIANLISKIWVTRVIGPQLERIIDEWNNSLTERSKKEADAYEKAKDKETRLSTMNGKEILSEMSGVDIDLLTWDMVEQNKDLIEKYVSSAHADVDKAKKELDKASTPTKEDVGTLVDALRAISPELADQTQELLDWLTEFKLMKGDASNNLSSLQQGISQISETTANALEAYMNGVSQQVYYHSSLLEQIRDSVVGLDMDVSLGVQSQMLLQLQNSYQTQQAIQQILEGVLVPSGRAFAVELLS